MLSKNKLVSNGNNAEQCYGLFLAQCVHFGVFSKCQSGPIVNCPKEIWMLTRQLFGSIHFFSPLLWLPAESLAVFNFNVLQIIENWGFLNYWTRSGQFYGNWWRSSCFSAFYIHEKFLRQPSWQFEDGIPFNLSMSCLCKLWRET
jgi:hypothetical protein